MRANISLRVSTFIWTDERRCDELLVLLGEHRGTIGEVAFFTGFTHPPLPLATLRERAAILARVIPRFKALGLVTGINHLATLGHLDENLANSLNEPWQHLVDIDGSVSRSCYCAADPRVQEYVRESYGLLAGAGPDFIWVDDDVRLESHPQAVKMACFCEHCLAEFAKETGTTWQREALHQAFNGGTIEARLRLRRQWLEHNRGYISRLLATVRAAVDPVAPDTPLGFMTAEIMYSGYGFAACVDAMAGKQRVAVKWRPGGGFYTDDYPLGVLAKAHGTGRQVAQLPATLTDIQYEHENFPYQPLKKSVTIFTAEIAAAIGAGCTGVALNTMGISSDPFDEYRPYFAGVGARRRFYDKAVAAFGRSPCAGVWPAFTRDHVAAQNIEGDWAQASLWGGDLHAFNELAEIGIPQAYSRDGAKVALLSGDNVLEFSREELLGLLAGGVLLDGPALTRLNAMGLAEHTGFEAGERRDRDTTEMFTADEINGRFAGWHRDCRPSFWPEAGYLVKPLTPSSRALAELIDFTPTRLGVCSGVFENALGGRVAVLGYYPWRSLQSLAKTMQMRALCRWLSRDTLPAWIASFHRAAVWCRTDRRGRPALMLLNASIDTAEGIELCINGDWPAITVAFPRGRGKRLARESVDGACSRFRLDPLGPWDAALVTVP